MKNINKLIAIILVIIGAWLLSISLPSIDSPEPPIELFLYSLLAFGFLLVAFFVWRFRPPSKRGSGEAENTSDIGTASAGATPTLSPKEEDVLTLPEKIDTEKHYVDDAAIAQRVNDAIDLAAEGKWEQATTAAEIADRAIDDFVPYDTSDVYYEPMWRGTLQSVRSYVDFHRKSRTP